MNVDAALRRYFPAINLGLIAAAAYFHASGIGHLIAAALAPTRPWFATSSKIARGTPEANFALEDQARSARATWVTGRRPAGERRPLRKSCK